MRLGLIHNKLVGRSWRSVQILEVLGYFCPHSLFLRIRAEGN
jgi:hypothetical protein